MARAPIEIVEQYNLLGEPINAEPLIDRDALADMLFTCLNKLTIEQFAGLLTNEFAELLEYAELVRGEKACQKTSLLFNPHRLSTRTHSSKESIYDALQDRGFVSGLARAVLFKHGRASEVLYQALQLGVNGIQYVSDFPPHIARGLCNKYGVVATSRVLDPCAGWGGRMTGVSTVADYYCCFDPAPDTCRGLRELELFIKQFRPAFTADIAELPFEDSELAPALFDFALTSPPYYDTELYSTAPGDSACRYASFDEWRRGFFLPLIDKTLDALKPGMPFVINVGSRTWPLEDALIDHCQGKYSVRNLGNLLSGRSGLGKDAGRGEQFYELLRTL